MLRFVCPTIRLEFDSGIILDEDTYLRNRLTIVRAVCPHCHQAHRFLLADAVYRAEAIAA